MLSDNTLRLQSILLPREDVCSVEEIYYHNEDDRVLFDGYFNLFALDKWRKYTQIDNLRLHIKCSGFKAIVLMNDRKEIQHIDIDPNKGEYDVEFPYSDGKYNLVFWFALVKDIGSFRKENIHDINGYFYTEINNFKKRPVNIVADICTFKREWYVQRNLKQLKESILDSKELEVGKHFKIYIVDNGKTLKDNKDIADLVFSCGDKVKIFENLNAGGAGGFTRGMMEAIAAKNKEKFSHVLLMDDDAVNEPDSIVRLYALLSTLRDEWKNVAVGGSMMREDFPFILYENGATYKKGRVITYREKNDIRKYENAVVDYVMKPYGENERFSGWWFYCAPLTTVRADNLPLPVFIHMDDIEYGIRNEGEGIIFLNGIGVWHRAFDLTDSTMNVYTYVRNALIMLSVHDRKAITKSYMLKSTVLMPVISYLIRYRYRDLDVIIKAIEDYLKGPDYIMNLDPADFLKEMSAMGDKFKPLEDFKDILSDKDFNKAEQVINNYDSNKILKGALEMRRTGSPKYTLSLNGWLFPAKNDIKVLSVTESPVKLFRYKRALLFEPYSHKAFVGEKKYSQLFKGIGIFIKGSILLITKSNGVSKKYMDAYSEMTSLEFWQRYLKL